MSAVKEKGRKLLKRIRPDDRLKLSVFLSFILNFISGFIIVSRIRPSGAAYLFSTLDVAIFALVLLPLGASEALHDLILKRAQIGFLKNAKRIFTSAFLHILGYVIICLIIWGISAQVFSEHFLFGKSGYTTLLWAMPIFAVDAFILLLRGYSDGYYRGYQSAYILLAGQFIYFLMVVFFAGRDTVSGQQVAKLLRNEEVQYIYDAIDIERLVLIASSIILLIRTL